MAEPDRRAAEDGAVPITPGRPGATRGEAAPLERGELVAAGERQDGRLDEPRPCSQPRRRVDDVVEADVAEERDQPEGRARRARTRQEAARARRGRAGRERAASTTRMVGRLAGSIIAATITIQPTRNSGTATGSGGPPSIRAWWWRAARLPVASATSSVAQARAISAGTARTAPAAGRRRSRAAVEVGDSAP